MLSTPDTRVRPLVEQFGKLRQRQGVSLDPGSHRVGDLPAPLPRERLVRAAQVALSEVQGHGIGQGYFTTSVACMPR
jgi:hypothetical protein